MPIINDYGYGGNNGMYMPVGPIGYGGNGGGMGDLGGGWWIILLLLCGWGGFGGLGGLGGLGGFGGFGGLGLGIDFPWLLNGQNQINSNTNAGFRDAMLNDGIHSIGDKLSSGFGDVQLGISGLGRQICETGNAVTGAVRDGFSAAEIAANQRQMASMQQGFGIQSTMQQGFCDNRAATADLKYTVATEACADRTAANQNTRDIIDAIRSGNQGIMDKLCQLELDGVKGQYAAAQREIVGLQNQLNMAAFRESQANQNALFQQGLNNEVDALYNRLKNCPVGTTPVYGNQPIFTCPQQVSNGYGCGFAA